jgi:TolB-like protein
VSSAILRDDPVPARSLRADLPADLARVIVRCLEKDPERRIQTAKDVRNELELLRRAMGPGADRLYPGSRSVGADPSKDAATAPGGRVAAGASDAHGSARSHSDPGGSGRSSTSGSDAPSIAVLRFANRSRSEEDEYFSDGLADELTSVLVKIRGLRVAARTSSASFKGKNATIAEVGGALGVATVLEGSVRKSGSRVRISVQLVKVEDGYPLWSETYDRTLDDIFAVQDDIAQSVVKELRTTLLGEAPGSHASGEAQAEVAAAARGRGDNAEAHRLYLQGKHLVERVNQVDVAEGIERLREALTMEPAHALAWVTLSQAHSLQAGYGWVTVSEGATQAQEAIDRAGSKTNGDRTRPIRSAPSIPSAVISTPPLRGSIGASPKGTRGWRSFRPSRFCYRCTRTRDGRPS